MLLLPCGVLFKKEVREMQHRSGRIRMFLIFLALSTLFSQASCTQTEPSEEENTQRLEMEDLPVTYSSAFEQKILAQCLSLFRRTRRLLKMEAPDPAQEAALSERIAADLLPTLEELPLYESEWEGICLVPLLRLLQLI